MSEKKHITRLKVQDKAKEGKSLKTLLTEQGFLVSEASDVGLSFKFEGGTYYISPQENDPEFFHLLYPNFWSLDNDDQLGQALFACDLVNREGKLVKLHTVENDVWSSIECLHQSPADFMAHLLRYLGYLQESVRAFSEIMLSVTPPEPEHDSEARNDA